MSGERDTKKKRLRARNARFSGAENTRARAREPAEMAMMTIHIMNRTPYDKSKSDLKKPSEPEEKERGRESFFCISVSSGKFFLDTEREREREKEKEKETRTSAMML